MTQTSKEYMSWILSNELNEGEMAKQRVNANLQKNSTLISIVMPVFRTPSQILTDTINSVLAQTYSHWELCIVNASPENGQLKSILDKFLLMDHRIHVRNLSDNEGISGNTNHGIAIASGDYIAFLDHDDLLAPFALTEVAKIVFANPQVDVIYSDEDRISSDGFDRYDPCFRPDFSPDILRSNNYMPHFLVVRHEVGEKAGWMKSGFEGAQDHEFILRVTEGTRSIIHIPKILYHWRAISGSTALSDTAKPYTHSAGTRAIEDHIWRIGRHGRIIDGHGPNYHVATYCVYPYRKVSIIILHSSSDTQCIRRCVKSILQNTSYPNFEIIIGFHLSNIGNFVPLYDGYSNAIKIKEVALNSIVSKYSSLNTITRSANGEILLFLDENSEIINPDWLSRLVEHVIWPENGAIGGMLLKNDKNVIYNAGYLVGGSKGATTIYRNFPEDWPGYFGMLKHHRNISALPVECMMVRKELFDSVQGFDPSYTTAFGDVDFCIRLIEKKYLNIWTPFTRINIFTATDLAIEDEIKVDQDLINFKGKNQPFLAKGDLFYSANLSPEEVDYGSNTVLR